MSVIFAIILPLFLIVLTGYGAGLGKWLDLSAARILARFVFLFAMPVAVFSFYIGTPPPNAALFGFLGAYFLAMLLNIALAIWSAQTFLGLNIHQAGAHAFVSTCGNAVFLGLPIALAIEGWGQPFLFLMILEGTFVFGICAALMKWQPQQEGNPLGQLLGGLQKSALLPFKNPIVVASLLGAAASFVGLSVPAPVQEYLTRFGAVASATGLFVLGLYIAVLPRQEVRAMLPNIGLASVLKLLVFPALTGGLIFWFTGGDRVLTGAGILFTAMPPAVASIVQASHYEVYEKQTTAIVALASPVSLFSIAMVLVIFAG